MALTLVPRLPFGNTIVSEVVLRREAVCPGRIPAGVYPALDACLQSAYARPRLGGRAGGTGMTKPPFLVFFCKPNNHRNLYLFRCV
jgi:hypothetical protein